VFDMRLDPEFNELYRRIWMTLRAEVQRMLSEALVS
jgi:hypothetical protein